MTSYGEEFSVSFSHLPLKANEQIVAYRLSVTEARIKAFPIFPDDWSFKIENSFPVNVAITGGIIHGAAALDEAFFEDFLIIEATQKDDLRVKGEVFVTTGEEDPRSISLTDKNVIVNVLDKMQKKGAHTSPRKSVNDAQKDRDILSLEHE